MLSLCLANPAIHFSSIQIMIIVLLTLIMTTTASFITPVLCRFTAALSQTSLMFILDENQSQPEHQSDNRKGSCESEENPSFVGFCFDSRDLEINSDEDLMFFTLLIPVKKRPIYFAIPNPVFFLAHKPSQIHLSSFSILHMC